MLGGTAFMSPDIQNIIFMDWEGEGSIFYAPKQIKGALWHGMRNFAERYGTTLQSLRFVYNGKVVDYTKSAEQLGMTGDAKIFVSVVHGPCPRNDPISIRFEGDDGALSEPVLVKPSWYLFQVCALVYGSGPITFDFYYRDKLLNLNVDAAAGSNVDSVRKLGLQDGDTIRVRANTWATAVAKADPLDFVRARMRVVTSLDGQSAIIFATVVDYVPRSDHWIIQHDASGDYEVCSRMGLIRRLQQYWEASDKDVAPRVQPPEKRFDDSPCFNADFEKFLFKNIGDLSLDAINSYWSKKLEGSPALEKQFIPNVAANSLSALQCYLINAELPFEVARAHCWTIRIFCDARMVELNNDCGDLKETFEAVSQGLHGRASNREAIVKCMREITQSYSQAPLNDDQPGLGMESKVEIGFLDSKSNTKTQVVKVLYGGTFDKIFSLYADWCQIPLDNLSFNYRGRQLEADQTPASMRMKKKDTILAYHRFEPVSATATAMKFFDAPEHATRVIEEGGGLTIRLVDAFTYNIVRFQLGASTMLKRVFQAYSEHVGISLRDLTFAHKGRAIFVSSAGNRTIQESSICCHDTILVSVRMEASPESRVDQTKPKASEGKKKKKRPGAKSKRKKKTQQIVVEDEEEKRRREHSEVMSTVFEEADSVFRRIRQRLAAMDLERTLPKERAPQSPTPTNAVEPSTSAFLDDLSGKAGKTHFYVQVGEVSNLYKSSKPSTAQLSSQTSGILIDLHGLTKDKALDKLEESLPRWVDTAQKGSYPFVICVKIVVGGGSQILAEAVQSWIKQKRNVCNAPKNLAH